MKTPAGRRSPKVIVVRRNLMRRVMESEMRREGTWEGREMQSPEKVLLR